MSDNIRAPSSATPSFGLFTERVKASNLLSLNPVDIYFSLAGSILTTNTTAGNFGSRLTGHLI